MLCGTPFELDLREKRTTNTEQWAYAIQIRITGTHDTLRVFYTLKTVIVLLNCGNASDDAEEATRRNPSAS